VAVVAICALGVYLGLLALLYSAQREMPFVRGRTAHPPLRIYTVQRIIEDDGTRITVWRADAAAPRAPVVVFFYGNAGVLSDFAPIGAALHGEGYGVLLASYRGYAPNGGAPSEDGILHDARAALASLPKAHGPVIDDVHMPVLIVSGTADATVPFDMAQTLATRLGNRATFVPIPGGGHDLPEWDVLAIAQRWLRAAAVLRQAQDEN
jgi:alpha-beta hydrolase superfamily lysophospholipase